MKKKVRENDTFVTSAEYQVLAMIAKDPEMEINLRKQDFPHPKAQTIFKAMVSLRETDESINFGSLLRVANRMDSTIDASYVSSILNFEVTQDNFTKAVETLAQASLKHKASIVVDTLSAHLDSPEVLNPENMVEYLNRVQEVFERGRKKSSFRTIEEVFNEYIAELELRKKGVIYPFHDTFLDTNLTRKASPGQIILCSATTGVGKSIYGLNLINGLINLRVPVFYASLEMDIISTAERLACMRTGVTAESWYDRSMTESLIRMIKEEIKSLLDTPFGFTDDPSLSIDRIRMLVRSFKKRFGVDYLILFLDLVTQVKEFVSIGKGNTLATTMELAVNKLNVLAKQENICIFAIAQMGRPFNKVKIQSVDQIKDLRPTLEQIKNSNALGERSRVVISVFREKYIATQVLPDDPELAFMEDILDAHILKQNMGPVGNIGKYLFDGGTSSLRPVPTSQQQDGQDG